MKQIEFTDEATFITETINVTDEHYELTEQMYNLFGDTDLPFMVRNDKKSLCFCVNKGENRIDREIGTNLYRITIEKL